MSEYNNINHRLEEIETRQAFQEDLIEQLNNELIVLNERLISSYQLIDKLEQKLASIPNSQIAPLSEETPPPHY